MPKKMSFISSWVRDLFSFGAEEATQKCLSAACAAVERVRKNSNVKVVPSVFMFKRIITKTVDVNSFWRYRFRRYYFGRDILGIVRISTPWCLLFVIGTLLSSAQAEFVINGYGTVGVSKSDYESKFEGWTDDEIDYKSNTQLAVNMVQEVSQQFSANAQVIARGEQDFDAELRLMNLNWVPGDGYLLRVGKIRSPILLMSEYQEVGVLYPWSKPPGEIYNLPIDTMVGINGAVNYQIAEDWTFKTSFAAGGGRNVIYGADTVSEGDAKDLILFNLDLMSSYWHFRVGVGKADYSGQVISTSVGGPPSYTQTTTAIPAEIQDAEFATAGLKYLSDRYLLQSEYVSLRGKLTIDRKKLFTSHYVTAGIYFGENYLVHTTRSVMRETETLLIAGEQITHAVGVNYIYNRDLVFKVDYKVVEVEGGKGNFAVQPDRDVNVGERSVNCSF